MSSLRQRPRMLAVLLLATGTFGAAALAGCGSDDEAASADELRADFEEGARQGAEETAAEFGFTDAFRDCLVDEVLGQIDIVDSIDDPEQVVAEAERLGEEAAGPCIRQTDAAVVVPDPTAEQTDALLATAGAELEQGLLSGGLPAAQASCTLERLGELAPADVASIFNQQPSPAVVRLVRSCG